MRISALSRATVYLLMSLTILLAACGSGGGGSDSTPTTDTTPSPFTFADQSGVEFNTATTSTAVTITGINQPASVSINGGEYSINGGSFTSENGTISNNSTLEVRVTSGADFDTTTSATVTIGGVSDSFDVTTKARDSTPDTFSITNQADVALNSPIESSPITISGINVPASLSISGGVYSIDGGAYTSADGTVSNGQTVKIRVTSSTEYQTSVTAKLIIGGVSANFVVTTIADTIDPTAAIVFPPFDNTVAEQQQLVIRGTAADNDAVKSVSVNGVTASSTDNFATWQASVNLTSSEDNTITVSVTDAAGNTNATAATVNIFQKNGHRLCGNFVYDPSASMVYPGTARLDLATNQQYTLIPSSTLQFTATAFDTGGSRAFGLSSGAVYEIDETDNTTSTISPQGTDGVDIGYAYNMVFDPTTDVLYAYDRTNSRIVAISTVNGSRQVISDNTNAGPDYGAITMLSTSSGRLFASAEDLNLSDPAIVEINLSNGDKTIIANKTTGTGQNFRGIEGLQVDVSTGYAWVEDLSGDLIQVVLASGNRTVASENDNWVNDGLTFEQNFSSNLDTATGKVMINDCNSEQLISIDLSNGARTLLTKPYRGAGPTLNAPFYLAYNPTDDLLVMLNRGGGVGPSDPHQKIRTVMDVSPSSGDRTILTNDLTGGGDAIGDMANVDYDSANDRILVLDKDNKALLSINPLNGLRTTLSDNTTKGTGSNFSGPTSVAVTSDGNTAYVTNGSGNSIIQVDLTTGNRTTLSKDGGPGAGPGFAGPTDIVLNADDTMAYVTNQGGASVYSVNLADGTRTVIASNTVGSGTALTEPNRLTFDKDNNQLFVIDETDSGIMTINLDTLDRTLSNSSGAYITSGSDLTYDHSRGLVFGTATYGTSLIVYDPETSSAVIVSN